MHVLGLLVVLSVTVPDVFGIVTPNYMMFELRYSSRTVSWGTAWATCQEHTSSHLIDIKDSVRNTALRHFFKTSEGSAMRGPMWTGVHYVNTVRGREFLWSDCQAVNESLPWLDGEPSDPEERSCITSSRTKFLTKTHYCNSEYVFICQKINGDCTYSNFKNQVCDTTEGRVILEGTLSNAECRDRCSTDRNGPDLCWAFERDKTTSICTLIFSPSPYVCETMVSQRDFESAVRKCFEFSDITGKKEKIVESNVPVSACVTAEATTTAATTTTAPSTTTSITTTTTTTLNVGGSSSVETQSSTSSIAGVESTHTAASVVTTTLTPSMTMTATSEPSAVTTGSTSTTSTSESPTVTTSATSATTTVPLIATTATRDTDTPTSIPITSTTSSDEPSSSSPGGSFSPSINTFLSRLEATLTNPRSASPTVTSPGRYVYEVCVAVQTFTVAEREKRTDDIVSDLLLDKKNLSSYRRKKSSAEDDRPSAQNVGGGVAIMLLVTAALIIILPDCSSILMHVVHAHKKKQLVPAQQ